MKYRLIQNSFSSGELSTKLDARTDLEEYFKGADTLENFLTYRQGGITRRPGFRYQSEITSVTAGRDIKLLPFIVSKTVSYLIAIEVLTTDSIKIRAYDNTGASVSVSPATKTIGGASGSVDDGRGLSNTTDSVYGFNAIQSADTMFITHADGVMRPLVLQRTEAGTFTLKEYFDAYFSTSKLSLGQAFQDSNIDPQLRIQVAAGDETADHGETVTLDSFDADGTAADNRNPIFRVSAREGHHNAYVRVTAGSHSYVAKIKSGTTGIPAVTGLTVTNANTSSNDLTLSGTHSLQVNDIVKLTGTVPGGVTADTEYYVMSMASGSTIKLSADREGSGSAALSITGSETGAVVEVVKTSRVVTGLITDSNGNIDISDNWAISSFNKYQGYPRAVTAFEQRLVFGGTIKEPDTIWGSLSGNMFHMMGTKLAQDGSSDVSGIGFSGALVATDPYQLTIASQEINAITWMASQRALEVGTLGSEYIISGGDSGLSPLTVPKVQAQTSHGGDTVRPVRIAGGTLFVSRDGQTIRDFKYSNDQDSYVTRNISVSSDEIIHHGFDESTDSYAGTKIVDMAYQSSRGILWFVTSSNALVGCSIDYDTNTLSWHKHTLGGTDVKVHGLAVIPNSSGTFDDLYISVSRTFSRAASAGTKFYLEKIGDDFEHTLLLNTSTSEDDKPYYSDSSTRIDITTQAKTIESATHGSEILTVTGHPFGTGTQVQLAGSDLPNGLSASTNYYVIRVTADTFMLASTPANAFENTPVAFSDNGSGAMTITPQAPTNMSGGAFLIGGFTHLEGEEVEVVADGFYETQGFVPRPKVFRHSDVSTGANSITLTQHEFFPGTKVVFSSDDTLPAGITAGTEYYVIVTDANTIKLALTEAVALARTKDGASTDVVGITNDGTDNADFLITPISCKTRVYNGLVGIKPTRTSAGTFIGGRKEMLVGLKYTSTVKTMKLEAGQEYGTAQGSLKRNEAVVLKFYRTYGGKFGEASNEDAMEEMVFRPAGHAMGSALTLFTGDKYLDFPSSTERFFQVIIKQDKALPMALLAIIHRGVSYDG